jgi:hypothetical protein
MSRGCAGPLTRCAGRLASGMALAIAASAAAALLPPPAAAASLTNPMWTVSKTTTGATAVTYAYSFAAASSSSLSSVTMTVPPGTGGSPAISTVSPPALAGGSVTLAGTTLTTTTYPVAITTAPSSPTPVTVCDVSAGTGTGPVTIGGHTASNPVAWWVNVPANALAGSYTTTITVAIVSGP